MREDMDLTRDASAAFGPDSVRTGAVLPYEGRTFLQRAERLPDMAFAVDRDAWLSPATPVLVRGGARILPLGWLGDPAAPRRDVDPREIDAFAQQMLAAGMQWAGNWRALDPGERRDDSIGSYLDALRAAGTTRADCWTYSETAGIALVWAGEPDGGTASLAMHVVPASWVSDGRATKRVAGVDLRWSWADVVALADRH